MPSRLPFTADGKLPTLKQWWRMLGELPLRLRLSFLLLWCLLSLAILLASVLLTEDSRQQQFVAATQHIKKTLEERLLICETAVYGFTELSASNYGAEQIRLQQFAQNIGNRYPYIYLMGFQPKISIAEREGFEAAISFRSQRPFFIKDYQGNIDGGWLDDQRWRPSPVRPFYIPLVDTQPASARRYDFLTGLDIAQDNHLGPAVQQAVRSGEIEITRPYAMREGGYGFGYVKAVYAEGIAPEGIAAREATAIGIITVGVRVDSLLAVQNTLSAPLNIRLLPNPPAWRGHAIKAATPVAANPGNWLSAALFPSRQAELSVERDYFPYRLQISRPASSNTVPPYLYGLSLGAGAVISVLLLLIAASQNNERLQSERYHEALHRQRQQAMVTLENVDDAVLVVDRDFRIEYANPQAGLLLGRTATDIVGQPLRALWSVRYELAREVMPDPVIDCIQHCHKTELPENAYLLHGDGQGHYIEGTVSPLFDHHGQLTGVVITFRDMAPLRQRMAEALDRSEQRLKQHQTELARVSRINTLGEMTSGIAHEINQPLSAIVSYNEACLTLLDDEEPDYILLKTALHASVKQAQRAGHIVKKLREFVASKRAELMPVSLNQAVLNVITLIESELRDHQVSINTDLAPGLPLVFADTIQTEQVIMNLCKNAMEAMMEVRDEHRLFIYSERRGERVRIGVRDNGPGIPGTVLQQIFQPFFSSKPGGMGLGLTISHTIIENMGGTLAARNLETGGAEFYFELPELSPSHQAEGAIS